MKKLLAVLLMLVMVFSFTACGGDNEEVEEDLTGQELPTVEELIEGMNEATADMKSYRFDMEMDMEMTGESEGEPMEVTMTMDTTGAFDNENREMMMDMNMVMGTSDDEEIEMTVAVYIIDGMMYSLTDMPLMGMEGTWTKMEMPAGTWEMMGQQVNQVESMVEIIDALEIEISGIEKVSGKDCYILEVDPDPEDMWELLAGQTIGAGEIGNFLGEAEEYLDEILKDISVKYWVEKDTYFLSKAVISMRMKITPEIMGYAEEEGEVDMTMTMNMLTYDYNQPVTIVLPAEAAEAVEM
jgi:hypothetical protein